MARVFAIKPTMSMKNRTFKGLRGFAGRPFHPPLTDIPVAAYVFAMVFDVSRSSQGGTRASAATRSPRRRTRSSPASSCPSPRRSRVSGTGEVDAAWHPGLAHRELAHGRDAVRDAARRRRHRARLQQYDDRYPSAAVVVLSVLVGSLVSDGAAYGGTLVYEYGFNVETAVDSRSGNRRTATCSTARSRTSATRRGDERAARRALGPRSGWPRPRDRRAAERRGGRT